MTQQGVKANSAKEHSFNLSLVGKAAQYDAIAECGMRAALSYAATELGWKAFVAGINLNLENLRRENWKRRRRCPPKGRKRTRRALSPHVPALE